MRARRFVSSRLGLVVALVLAGWMIGVGCGDDDDTGGGTQTVPSLAVSATTTLQNSPAISLAFVRSMTWLADGKIAMAATDDALVRIYAENGSVVLDIDGTRGVAAPLVEPVTVCVDSSGNYQILDRSQSRVVACSPDGAVLSTFGQPGSGVAQLSSPEAMAVDGSGDLLVADTGNRRLLQFTRSGSYLGTAGAPTMSSPVALAIDGLDAFVLDRTPPALYTGTVRSDDMKVWSAVANAAVELRDALDVAVDRRDKRVYVLCEAGMVIRAYDAERNVPEMQWTAESALTRITVDQRSGDVLALDALNSRVVRLSPASVSAKAATRVSVVD